VTVGIEEKEEEQEQVQKLISVALQDSQERQGARERGLTGEEIAIYSSKPSDIWTLYLYAMKSPATREKYQRRFIKFLDFLGLTDNDAPLP
jgi:hypothetical protein